jgi:hypothetical protein
MKVHVRLTSTDPSYNRFLADHEVTVTGGTVEPLSYGGRLFVFLNTMLVGSYGAAKHEEAYVFTDAGPAFELT